MIRTVGVVAIAAIFYDRRMLPKVGAALFGMTVEAGIVERLTRELPFACLAVSAMASAAVHLALSNRMRMGLERLRALLPMTFEAYVCLCRCHQHRIACRMTRMAVRTRDIVHVVVITVPAEAGVRLVTIQAQAILYIDWCRGARAEYSPGRRALLPAPHPSRVIARWAVACLALQLPVTEWSVRISRVGMSAPEQRED